VGLVKLTDLVPPAAESSAEEVAAVGAGVPAPSERKSAPCGEEGQRGTQPAV